MERAKPETWWLGRAALAHLLSSAGEVVVRGGCPSWGHMAPKMEVANVLTSPRAEAVASMLSLSCSMEGEGRSPARAASCRQDTKLVKLGLFHALRGARGLARASGDLMHVPAFTGTVILGL